MPVHHEQLLHIPLKDEIEDALNHLEKGGIPPIQEREPAPHFLGRLLQKMQEKVGSLTYQIFAKNNGVENPVLDDSMAAIYKGPSLVGVCRIKNGVMVQILPTREPRISPAGLTYQNGHYSEEAALTIPELLEWAEEAEEVLREGAWDENVLEPSLDTYKDPDSFHLFPKGEADLWFLMEDTRRIRPNLN